jgi:pSer/pThr/pTyr-binding forkhead associated (FHA) protein
MKSFLNACGLFGPFYLTVEGPGTKGVETRSLQQPYAIIGRDPRTDVVIDDTDVSRRHVYIQVVEGRAFWVDLDSRLGIRGADGTAHKTGWLEHDRPISVGPFPIARAANANPSRAESDRPLTAKESPLLALSYGRSPLPNVALEFLNGPTRSEFWPMHRVMSLIGSSRGCKFRLTDRSVSLFHASLVRTSLGLWIIDLRGASSIIVNETAVRCVRLTDGDILGIGRYRIRVRYQVWERTGRDRSAVPMPDSRSTRQPATAGSELSLIDHSSSALAYEPGPHAFPGSGMAVPPLASSHVPGVQMVPLEATFATRIDESMISQSILVPLVNQFSMMQQQMFDQFQQSMGMLVQMFSTMHRDQMEVIHEELGRLKELTSELHSLKVELASRPSGAQPVPDPIPEASASPSASPSVPDLEEIERMLANTRSATSASPSASGATAAAPVDGPNPSIPNPSIPLLRPPPGPSVTEPALTPQQVAALVAIRPTVSPVSPSHAESTTRRAQPIPQRAASSVASNRSASVSTANPATAHPQQSTTDSVGAEDSNSVAWLHHRIVTLQRERETRWQKILKLLPGNS